MPHITPFLMFTGQAETAMKFYMSLFPDSEIKSIIRYAKDQGGTEGSVMHAVFTLNGQQFMCIDSSVQHAFTFTPALSLHVTLDSEAEVDHAFAQLSDGGSVLMPLDTYPFSKKYGWVNDRFGVSWQLSLAPSVAD